jgi:hypothetical protein
MDAYLIDPKMLQVTKVTIGTDYTEIYKFIECSCFTTIEINNKGDALYIDDEGLLVDWNEQVFFKYEGWYGPLAGKGLVLGCDLNTGESRSPIITLEEVQRAVSYITPRQACLWASGL